MQVAGQEITESPLRARLHTLKKNWQRAEDGVVLCRPGRSLDRDLLRPSQVAPLLLSSISAFSTRATSTPALPPSPSGALREPPNPYK